MSDPVAEQRAALERGATDSTSAASMLTNVSVEDEATQLGLNSMVGEIDELIARAVDFKSSAEDALQAFAMEAHNSASSAAAAFAQLQSSERGDVQDLIGSSQRLSSDTESWNPGSRMSPAFDPLIDALNSAKQALENVQSLAGRIKTEATDFTASAMRHVSDSETISAGL